MTLDIIKLALTKGRLNGRSQSEYNEDEGALVPFISIDRLIKIIITSILIITPSICCYIVSR